MRRAGIAELLRVSVVEDGPREGWGLPAAKRSWCFQAVRSIFSTDGAVVVSHSDSSIRDRCGESNSDHVDGVAKVTKGAPSCSTSGRGNDSVGEESGAARDRRSLLLGYHPTQ